MSHAVSCFYYTVCFSYVILKQINDDDNYCIVACRLRRLQHIMYPARSSAVAERPRDASYHR